MSVAFVSSAVVCVKPAYLLQGLVALFCGTRKAWCACLARRLPIPHVTCAFNADAARLTVDGDGATFRDCLAFRADSMTLSDSMSTILVGVA